MRNLLCLKILILIKGHLILKCLSGVFTFLQKANKNKWTNIQVKFVCSFFGRNVGLKKSFRICLTFINVKNLRQIATNYCGLIKKAELYVCDILWPNNLWPHYGWKWVHINFLKINGEQNIFGFCNTKSISSKTVLFMPIICCNWYFDYSNVFDLHHFKNWYSVSKTMLAFHHCLKNCFRNQEKLFKYARLEVNNMRNILSTTKGQLNSE